MRLLQVCNVGRIVGGTAACAWTITRAFPDVEHHAAFLSEIAPETRGAFAPAALHRVEHLTNRFVRDLGIDAVILHNTSATRMERISSAWTLQYVHSAGPRGPADRTVYCSQWLAERSLGPKATDRDVLYQAVPRPRAIPSELRPDADFVVGRLCTPTPAKWPGTLPGFYECLARQHPRLRWEFVGCPSALQAALQGACGGRATFHEAGWTARRHLARWHALLYHHPRLTESFGRTAAEAMRAGCVPIVDHAGGFREQLTPRTGFLCRDRTAFGEALAGLREPGRWQAKSDAAREHADREFSLSTFRARLLHLWRGPQSRRQVTGSWPGCSPRS